MYKISIKNYLLKLAVIFAFVLSDKVATAQSQSSHLFGPRDTAFVPKEIQDPECIGINKEPFHSTLMPYANLTEALNAKRDQSSFVKTLNGSWKFHYVDWPQKRPENFYKKDYDVSSWDDIKVPSNWQVVGYGTPYYSNFTYIFQKDFPNVMSTPPVSWTAYQERNPVGSYRRNFEVPANWDGRSIFLTFDGVDAGFFLWVNGKKIGYSVNSRNAAEFDITKYVKPGKNMVAVEVYRFTTGSYLEDQDMWRLSGIFRNVSLWSAPKVHIRDYFIKTDFDDKFQNATLLVSTKIKNYDTKESPARKLQVTLFDGNKKVGGVEGKQTIPALKPGEEVEIKLSIPVKKPKKWTAETPYLYTTVLNIEDGSKTTETISSKTGFRKIEIKGRLFLVNGVPIKLKGVNRHENWPDDGHAITEKQMIRDIVLIKQANCNHVRTCHYSDDPRWYELCDEYGIYLVAEANLECHGAWDQFNEEPRMKQAIISRNEANVQNFKNHPSVIIWSLGNECGSGGSNFRAALARVREIDPSRPTHYQGFGIGPQNPADIDSEMYTQVASLEDKANDTSLVKPFYLCEYAHAMFNSMGSVDVYNDIFDKYPQLLGGAIWEWQDQGIYNDRDPNHHITAYGGGFGEMPNDHYFIHKGVVFSDRSPKPHYPELKHAYQWLTIKGTDLKNGIITIKNRYQFLNLSDLTAKWELSEDGIKIGSGDLKVGEIQPGKEKTLKVPFSVKAKPGCEYFLRVSFDLASDKLWASKGFEVAEQQLELPISLPAVIDKSNGESLAVDQNKDSISISGNNFKIIFNKSTGTFSQLQEAGKNVLEQNGGPMLHLWRAPHQKDDMWAYKDWVKYGLNAMKWNVEGVKLDQSAKNLVVIHVNLVGDGKEGFKVNHQVTYTINGKGIINVANHITFNNPQLILARIGVRMFINKDYNQFSYLGRGPMENYGDRKSGFDVGKYSSSVAGQLTPYEKPMECGNHEDVRWANLLKDGAGIGVSKGDSLIQVSALPYSDEEMENVAYKIDLPKSNRTVLCVSHKTLGVGSNGCGPIPLKPYLVHALTTDFTYQLKLIRE
ncbi:beta-galactosidase [Pedobacter sp. UYP30]|uniref:glycoside hydrolase family 2 TIM barrel-domain containing protein n=1 Tax=Pedobacter sp. UYP30 TaxID=1756400 RepID=UPI003395B2BA